MYGKSKPKNQFVATAYSKVGAKPYQTDLSIRDESLIGKPIANNALLERQKLPAQKLKFVFLYSVFWEKMPDECKKIARLLSSFFLKW